MVDPTGVENGNWEPLREDTFHKAHTSIPVALVTGTNSKTFLRHLWIHSEDTSSAVIRHI